MKEGKSAYTCSFHMVEDKDMRNVASKPERRNKASYAGK